MMKKLNLQVGVMVVEERMKKKMKLFGWY